MESSFWGKVAKSLILNLLAEAFPANRPYTEAVELGQPLKWIRVAGGLVGILMTISSQSALWFALGGPKLPYWPLALVLQLLLVGLFLLNTRDFPAQRPWHSIVLLAQMLIYIPVNSDFGTLSAITIPLVRPAGKRLGWVIGQCLSTTAAMGFMVWRQWPAIVTQAEQRHLWSELKAAISTGLLELIGWNLLAYVAALLITQMESDRRRLMSTNAELLSSRSMLAESTRSSERLEIARELHDSLGHHLTTLNQELELAQRVPAVEKESHVKQAQLLARLLLADLRETVSSWRLGGSAGLPEALSALAKGINSVKVQVEIDPEITQLDSPQAHALLRCAQEAVTNALRHSAATKIEVSLRREGNGVLLTVVDNGQGCSFLLPGNGLSGIKERAKEFDGNAVFQSMPKGGFKVEVRLP